MRKIKREIVSALIISKDNKLLIQKEDPTRGGIYSDAWHIPGGGMEKGETILETLKREIMEEVGIDISGYSTTLLDNSEYRTAEKTLKNGERVLADMHFNDHKVIINNKNANEIKVKVSDEVIEYKWIPFNKLTKYKLTPPLRKLLSKLSYIN